MLAAAQAFVSFSAAAAAALESRTGPALEWAAIPAQGLTGQLMAATSALNSCISLAGLNPSLPSPTGVRIAAACSVVLGPGSTLLRQLIRVAEATAAAPNSLLHAQLGELCTNQLQSVGSAAILLRDHSTPQAAAAFAAGTAKPAALLPWLLAVVQAIQLGAQSRDSTAGVRYDPCALRLHGSQPNR